MEKDSLFKLVKSLSPNEKGYFMKYGLGVKENSRQQLQLTLLELLWKTETYDERKIKEAFGKKNEGDFRHIKFELFHRLLDTLAEYKKGQSVDSQAALLLERSRTLLNKGLHQQSRKFAEKAEELCNREERFDLSIVAITQQKDTFHNYVISAEMFEKMDELHRRETEAADKLRNISQYRSLFEQMRLVESVSLNADYSKDTQRKELERILTSEFLQDFSKALTHESRYLYHICYSIYYGTIKDHQNRLANSRALLQLMENTRRFTAENSSKYRNAINQFLNACLAAKDVTGFDEYLGLLEKHMSSISSPYMKARTFLIIQNQKLNKNFATDNAAKNREVIDSFKEELALHEQILPPEIFYALYCNIMITYFYCGDYRAAIPVINKIINEYNPKVNKGIVSIAQCINLLVHYELGNTDLLNYLLKSAKLEKDSKTGYFELTGWITLLLETELNKKEKQREKELKQLFASLELLLKDEGEKELMRDFYLDKWLARNYKKYFTA